MKLTKEIIEKLLFRAHFLNVENLLTRIERDTLKHTQSKVKILTFIYSEQENYFFF